MKVFLALLIFLSIIGESIPLAVFGQTVTPSIPEDAKGALDVIQSIFLAIPHAIAKVWKEEALPLFVNIWKGVVYVWFNIAKIFDPEIEKRKGYVEQEVQKDKEQLEKGQKTVETGQSLWERLKDLLKD